MGKERHSPELLKAHRWLMENLEEEPTPRPVNYLTYQVVARRVYNDLQKRVKITEPEFIRSMRSLFPNVELSDWIIRFGEQVKEFRGVRYRFHSNLGGDRC